MRLLSPMRFTMLALMSRLIVLVLLLLGSALVSAEVYRSIDEHGNVTYSDTPHEGAEEIEVSNPTIIPSTDTGTSFGQKPPPAPKALPYESVAVVQPQDQQTIRDNTGNVSVAIQIQPGLQSARFGHRLKLLFNGTPVGEPSTALRHTLPSVDRGTHTLQAVVIDARGAEIAKSSVSEFFLHKHSVRNP